MSLSVNAEDFWGCRLDGTNKVFEWKYPEEEEDEELQHKLFISQATLAAKANDKERNVIEVEVEDQEGSRKYTIASLKLGLNETIGLNLGFTSSVKFKLASGSGPVDLVGAHLIGSDEHCDEECEEMHSEIQDDSTLQEIPNGMNKKSLMGNMQKVMGSKSMDSDQESDFESDEESDVDDEDDHQDDEEDSDEEESEESESVEMETPPSKKIKNSGVGKSKKMKEEKENKSQTKVPSAKEKKSKSEYNLDMVKKAISRQKTLPKTHEKFENYLRANMKITDKKVIKDAWSWYQKTKLSN